MTYVLGVRSANGVVLVADRKLTINNGASFEFIDKIHGDIRGVLWAISIQRAIGCTNIGSMVGASVSPSLLPLPMP